MNILLLKYYLLSRSSPFNSSNSFIYLNRIDQYEYFHMVIHSSSPCLSSLIISTSLTSSIHYCHILLFIIIALFRLAFHDNTTKQFDAYLLFILFNTNYSCFSHDLIDQHDDQFITLSNQSSYDPTASNRKETPLRFH